MDFTDEERLVMMLYSPGDRLGLCAALKEMMECLEADEQELRTLAERVLVKLEGINDETFEQIDLYKDM